MAAKEQAPGGSEGTIERTAKIYRNFNAIAALAIGGLALIVPVGGAALGAWAGVDAVQAGAGEWARRAAKKKREQKG